MYILNTNRPKEERIPVRRLIRSPSTGKWEEPKQKPLFIRGPIPLPWVECAAKLPGKALALGFGLWWLHGMNKGGEVKLTKRLLESFNISRDAAADGLNRLEQSGLVQVKRAPGKRATVRIVTESDPPGRPQIGPPTSSPDHGSCVK
jgi:hypothetical protein